ncbi:MAG: Uma2 family endonuclease [Cyanobacteria bacterium P01_H01_bin.121]
MVTTTPLTIEQFLEWSADLEHPYELIDGIPTRITPERYINTAIARLLARYLDNSFEWYQITYALEIELDTGNSRIPDLCVVSKALAKRLSGMTRAFARLGAEPPLIVVEVVSPSSGERDYQDKLQEYARVGAQEYWILDPDAQTASIYRLNEASEYTLCDESELVSVAIPRLQALIIEAQTTLLEE